MQTSLVRWILVSAVALAAGTALLAQPPLTPTPAPAPGYTTVIVRGPVKAAQEGPWIVRAAQDGVWTTKLDIEAPSFIRAQRTYLFSWNGTDRMPYLVHEVRSDGWIRATANDGSRREQWINTRQLAAVEEVR